MGMGREVGLAYPVQQFTERRIPRRVRTQHQRIDEEPDQIVQRRIRTPRDRRADRDVRARTEPRQQSRQTRLEHHEETAVTLLGQGEQPLVGGRVQVYGNVGAGVGRHCGTHPVRRKGQLFGQVGELGAPVGDLLRQRAVGVGFLPHGVLLPHRVVGVLHRQRLPHRLPAGTPRRVRDGYIAGQRRHGPAVTSDVMQRHQQHMLVGREPEQIHPDRNLRRQVEFLHGGPDEGVLQSVLADPGGTQVETDLVGRQDLLARPAVRVGEDGAQALVAPDHVGEGVAQRLGIQRAAQPQGRRQVVVPAAPLHPVEEPQPLLGRRQRDLSRAFPGGQRRAGGGLGGPDPGRYPGHCRVLEQVPYGQLHLELATDASQQPGRAEGVAAQVEEVVVDADALHVQDVGEEPAEVLLALVARTPAAGGAAEFGGGQRLAVQLAVGGHRQRVHGDKSRGDHVLGQLPRRTVPQLGREAGRVERGPLRHHVGDQVLVAGLVLPHHHCGLGHLRVGGDDLLDLLQLDTEAAQLDLVVDAADELQLSVRRPPGQVARAVHPLTGRAEGVGHEAFCRQTGAAQIAAGKAGTGDVQLTRRSGRGGPQPAVEDVDAGVVRRISDGRGALSGLQRGAEGRADGRLAGPVPVDHPQTRSPPVHQLGGGGLTGHRQGAEGGEVRGRDGGQSRRRDDRMGHLLAEEDLGESVVGQRAEGRDDESGSRAVGHAELRHRGVEAGRGVLQDPAVGGDVEPVGHGRREARQALVGDDDALGAAGGAGGVDDVGGVGELYGDGGVVARPAGGEVCGVDQEVWDPVVFGEPGGVFGVGDEQGGRGVVEDVADPVGRVVRVDGQVGG
ncbi:hypothetical protein A3Q37_04843 [Streptomyces sp. PTY087I2]|nr:hypothetical protein A3Q37_04843 [Streptomyces sp. PTY087I2]